MGWIVIFGKDPGDDGGWIGVILLVILFLGGIGIWPLMSKWMASEENAEGRKTMIIFVVVLLLSCIVVTVIYNLVKSKFIETGFLTAYITIGIFTTVVTALAVGLILGLMDSEIAWEGQEIMALIVLSLFGSVLPSAMAAGISACI